MSFVHPLFLLALSAVIIPIIIHLFHFRRFKKVYFPNINFLERLSDETQKQARLKHLLVLLTRILAIALLVMAFARPYIPRDDQHGGAEGNIVSIYVDNSFSMEAGSSLGNLLDQARLTAAEIAASFNPTDRFQLLTNDFEARHQRFVSRDEFNSMLSEVDFSPSPRTIADVMTRQTEMLKEDSSLPNKFSFLLSDFQKNITEPENISPDTIIEYYLIPLPAPARTNVFIDSLWIDNPVRRGGQIVTLQVRIYNDSDQQLDNQPVRLYINDNQRAVATFNIAPFASTTVDLTYTLTNERIQRGYVEISDYPVTFDDRFYFSYNLNDHIPVMVINQNNPNRFLNALFGSDTSFVVRNMPVSSLDMSLFGGQNLIILNEIVSPGSGLVLSLSQYVEQGGNLLVLPPDNLNADAYRELFNALEVSGYSSLSQQRTRVTSINELHTIYSGVFDRMPENLDLPTVDKYYMIERHTRDRGEYLLQLQNGNALLTSTPSGQGVVYLSAVPANDAFSNFHRHAIFVPTLYNIALHSNSFYPLSYTIGREEYITIRNYTPTAGSLFRITAEQLEVIPEARNQGNNINLILHNQIQTQGSYSLQIDNDLLRSLSFNYDRRESLLESYSVPQLESIAAAGGDGNVFVFSNERISVEKQMELLKGGRQLWKLFLLIALALLITEVVLLRLWK
jgi:hypothetical protein